MRAQRCHFASAQVVCTLGPVSRSVEVCEELLRAGMNVARFNFSHGSHDYHQASASPSRLSPGLTCIAQPGVGTMPFCN